MLYVSEVLEDPKNGAVVKETASHQTWVAVEHSGPLREQQPPLTSGPSFQAPIPTS